MMKPRPNREELFILLHDLGTDPKTMRTLQLYTQASSAPEIARLYDHIEKAKDARVGLIRAVEGDKPRRPQEKKAKPYLSHMAGLTKGQKALMQSVEEAHEEPEHVVALMKSSRGLPEDELHARAKLVKKHGITKAYHIIRPHKR